MRIPAIVVDALIALVIAIPALVQWQFGLYSLPYYLSYSLLLIAPLVFRRVLPELSFATVAVLCLLQMRVISSPRISPEVVTWR